MPAAVRFRPMLLDARRLVVGSAVILFRIRSSQGLRHRADGGGNRVPRYGA